MNQKIVDYLKQNKDEHSREDLIKQLKKAEYDEGEINEAISNVYGDTSNINMPAPVSPLSSIPQAPSLNVSSKLNKKILKIIVVMILVVLGVFAVIMASIIFLSLGSGKKEAYKTVIVASVNSANSKASLCADAGYDINRPVTGELICDELMGKWPELDKPGRWGNLIDGDVSDGTFEYTLYVGGEKITCTEIQCNFHSPDNNIEHRNNNTNTRSEENKSVSTKKKIESSNNIKVEMDENSTVTIGNNNYNTQNTEDSSDEVIAYCNLKKEIKFGDKIFKLSWNNKVASGDYLLEYVPVGESVEHYHNMLSLECVENEQVAIDDAVAVFINNLETEKQKDNFVHYEVYENSGIEAKMVDSLLRDGDAIEWNIYKYQLLKQFTGTKGIIRFGFSRRVYGDERMEFMKNLSQTREKYIDVMTKINLEQIFK